MLRCFEILPEVLSRQRLSHFERGAMARMSPPPGFASSDVESSTVSRERRRITLAVKVAIAELADKFSSRLSTLESKLDTLLEVIPDCGEASLTRLETLMVCSPSADAVLEEMLCQRNCKQPDEELSPESKSFSYNGLVASADIPPLPEHKSAQFFDISETEDREMQTEEIAVACAEQAIQTD